MMPPESSVTYSHTMHEMPSEERPRERLKRYGANALSNAELLAILLRVGRKGENVLNLSQRILTQQNGLVGLAKADFKELARVDGLGDAKTCQIKAALELGRRLTLGSPDQRVQITSPNDVSNLLMLEMSLLDQEQLRVLLLDTKNFVIDTKTLYIGTVNSSVIRVAEVFREAIRANSTALIIVHNHPSGDPTPSPEDVHVTRRLVEAGRMMDIEVLDHIIIGKQRFVSLKERGLAFSG